MKYRFFSIALSAAALAMSAGPSMAADAPAVAPKVAASKAAPKESKAAVRKKEVEAKRKAAAKVKLVDINSASREQLMTLPGIDETDAGKIIAGRPYGSKSWLTTHKVLANEKYQGISSLIAAKNAARMTQKK